MYQTQMINTVLSWEKRLEIDDERMKNHQSASFLDTELISRPVGDNRFESTLNQKQTDTTPQPIYFFIPRRIYQDTHLV